MARMTTPEYGTFWRIMNTKRSQGGLRLEIHFLADLVLGCLLSPTESPLQIANSVYTDCRCERANESPSYLIATIRRDCQPQYAARVCSRKAEGIWMGGLRLASGTARF